MGKWILATETTDAPHSWGSELRRKKWEGPLWGPAQISPQESLALGTWPIDSLQLLCLWTWVLPASLPLGCPWPVTQHHGSPGPELSLLSAGFLHQPMSVQALCTTQASLSQYCTFWDFCPILPSLSPSSDIRPVSRAEGSPCLLLSPLHPLQELLIIFACKIIYWCLLLKGPELAQSCTHLSFLCPPNGETLCVLLDFGWWFEGGIEFLCEWWCLVGREVKGWRLIIFLQTKWHNLEERGWSWTMLPFRQAQIFNFSSVVQAHKLRHSWSW